MSDGNQLRINHLATVVHVEAISEAFFFNNHSCLFVILCDGGHFTTFVCFVNVLWSEQKKIVLKNLYDTFIAQFWRTCYWCGLLLLKYHVSTFHHQKVRDYQLSDFSPLHTAHFSPFGGINQSIKILCELIIPEQFPSRLARILGILWF